MSKLKAQAKPAALGWHCGAAVTSMRQDNHPSVLAICAFFSEDSRKGRPRAQPQPAILQSPMEKISANPYAQASTAEASGCNSAVKTVETARSRTGSLPAAFPASQRRRTCRANAAQAAPAISLQEQANPLQSQSTTSSRSPRPRAAYRKRSPLPLPNYSPLEIGRIGAVRPVSPPLHLPRMNPPAVGVNL